MEEQKNISGIRIKEARLARGKQQIEIAIELNIARTSYADLENGRRPVFDKELKFLSKYLNVDVRWLLGMNEAEEPVFPSKNKNIKRVKRKR